MASVARSVPGVRHCSELGSARRHPGAGGLPRRHPRVHLPRRRPPPGPPTTSTATGDTPVTRCTGSAGCCAAVPGTSPTAPGTGCPPVSRPATAAARSPRRGSPPVDLRLLYRAPDKAPAAHLLHELGVHCADSGVPELARLGRTLDRWRPKTLAAFDPRRHQQRTHRSRQPDDHHDQARRPRLPQLRQLPAPPAPALRHLLEHRHSIIDTTPSPCTRLGCVEPIVDPITADRGI